MLRQASRNILRRNILSIKFNTHISSAATGNPLAGAVAGAAAEEGVKRSGVGKKARKKAGLGHMEGHGKKKSSPWIEHVKNVAKTKGIPYGSALKIAKETYKKN